MYELVKLISFAIRAYLCYFTIDNIPILANQIANIILLEVISTYTILMVITRATVGRFYTKGENPTFGAILYFFYLFNIFGIFIWNFIIFNIYKSFTNIGDKEIVSNRI